MNTTNIYCLFYFILCSRKSKDHKKIKRENKQRKIKSKQKKKGISTGVVKFLATHEN
jgi:hypothetical protein